MLFLVLSYYILLCTAGQEMRDDWVDPYDMLNYDSSTKTMRKPAEQTTFTNVATKRREYTQDPSRDELEAYKQQIQELQKQIEEQKKTVIAMTQQTTCNPVFKRFLSRLLKEMRKVGEPSDSTDLVCDAKVQLSKHAMTEIQSLLDGEDRWRTGALDSAINQLLVNFKPHNYEAWVWRFEDTFGVELNTVVKISILVTIVSTVICTQMWSMVSWFVQFKRMFAVCFFISIVWNWFYLYQTAFAKHQNDIVKMENFNAKCTGVQKIDWRDNLKEWFRSTWTLQDDPCKKYYEVLMVNPLLLVPPTKAISVTITTFITEPLKHFGQGISEFLRELLKDLPITLQIPVLLTIVLSILIFMYGSVQAAFQHGIMAPFRRPQRDPPLPEPEQPQHRPVRMADPDNFAGGDAPAHAPPQQHLPRLLADNPRLDRNDFHRRRPRALGNKVASVSVKTTTVGPLFSEDETDAELRRHSRNTEEDPSVGSETEEQPKTQGEPEEQTAAANTEQAKTHQNTADLSQKHIKKKETGSHDKPNRESAGAKAASQTSQAIVQDLGASELEKPSSTSLANDEDVTAPVQETCPSVD